VKRWLPLGALVIIVIAALVVGTRGSHSSAASREAAIESEVRCPQCNGQSVQASDAPAARAVRQFVTDKVAAGESNGQIEQQLVDRYGADLLLRPPSSGLAGLVWVIPIVGFGVAITAIGLAFRRWKAAIRGHATDADRARVEEALADG
jgi:cytochrome c-type biogenesis protein CcmH